MKNSTKPRGLRAVARDEYSRNTASGAVKKPEKDKPSIRHYERNGANVTIKWGPQW